MKAFNNYWSFTAIRGALTLIVSAGILILPYFANALVTIPVAIGLAIDVLAVYAMLDAGALVLLGMSMPETFRGKTTRIVEACASVLVGSTLFVMTHGEFSQYLMIAVAVFAAITAFSEFSVARQTYRQYECLSCFVGFILMAACAIALPFTSALSVDNQILTLSSFVGLYGVTQLTLGARMLFLEYRSEHPAAAFSFAWRSEMNNPLAGLPGRVETHFASRGVRAAVAISHGYVVPGHAMVIPARQKAA